MKDMPFEKYEFLAILPPGFLLLSVNYIHFNLKTIFHSENVVHITSLILIAYVIGQMVAEFSLYTIEKYTKVVLGDPAHILADKCKDNIKIPFLSSNYQKPFKSRMKDLYLDRLLTERVKDEELSGWVYENVLSAAKNDSNPLIDSKLQGWVRLFGFARNCTMAISIQSIIFVITYFITKSQHNLWLALIAFFVSIILYLRYLRFFKTYSIELISWYLLKP